VSDLFGNEHFGAPALEDEPENVYRPLADILRPVTLDMIVGQDHLFSDDGPVSRMISTGRVEPMILWGPPGVGKTTLARLIVQAIDQQSNFIMEEVSAIFSGVGELRKIFDRAKTNLKIRKRTILFVDEIHRFNRAQQDSFLPHMETGLITLIGATTENPSFELNPALLSRSQILTLNRLDKKALEKLLTRAEEMMESPLPLDREGRKSLMVMADGDGRYLLNLAEQIFSLSLPSDRLLNLEQLTKIVQRRAPVYDKAQEGHYNLASALQKSVRGSDVDAALYWTARMLISGEDPKFILRRLIVMASEDIGNADPQALPVVIAARDAFEYLGLPEGEHALAQAVTYLATAPKSNAAYMAIKRAKAMAKKTGSLMPPAHAMNAPTKMMKDLGYGDGYIYDHDTEHGFSGLNYFPPDLPRQEFYTPPNVGYEREINKRLEWWKSRRENKKD